MLSNNKPSCDVEQRITDGIKDNQAREKVIEFILSCLEEFRKRFINVNPEDGLTQELTTLLDNKARIRLPICGFRQQPMEDTNKGNSPRDDIDVRAISGIVIDAEKYNDNEPFIIFEAKRLNNSLGNPRKKEYVVGRMGNDKYIDSGGIERFKKEIHGKKVNYVGMIGYMQTDNFDTWLDKVNSWIEEEIKTPSSPKLIWENNEKLNEDKSETIYRTYTSKHKCLSDKELDMYHIWVDLKRPSDNPPSAI